MDPDRRRRALKVLGTCLELGESERRAYLEEVCAGDEELRREVSELLEARSEAASFLEQDDKEQAAFNPVRDDEIEGRRIGPYKVLRLLSRGGMGAVYLAVRQFEGFEKRVALKLLQPDLQEREEILWRFRTERRILASLDHPNIARFLDGGTTDSGQPYFVMEYVEGQPIDRYCDAHRLSTGQRLELFRTVCSAVQAAHQNTVVHRDIKPANILVTSGGVPKLLDFGIVKLLNPELVAPSIAHTVLKPLTPEYASPEQVKGEPITTASDVYSLGVLLYELLTGHRPYRFESYLPSEMERTVCELEPEHPSTAVLRREERPGGAVLTPESVSRTRNADPRRLQRRLSGDLDNIVLMALRKEPRRRYASAAQLAEDIGRHLEGRPVIARGDSFTYRAGKFLRRHRLGVAVASAFLAATIGFGAVMAVQRSQVARALERAERVTAFLTELFEVSDPFVSTRELLDTGAQKLGRDLEGQPEVRAELEGKVGVIYGRIGLYDRASPLLESALETHRRLFGERHPKVAASLDDLGILRQQTGDYDAAERLLRQALGMRRELFSGDHADTAESLNNLGNLLVQKGDFLAAERQLREALDMFRRLGRAHEEAECLSDLALLLKEKGDRETAEKLLREALGIFRQRYGDDDLNTVTCLSNLAFLLRDQGQLEAAEGHFREVLERFSRRFGTGHSYVAQAQHNLAGVLLARGEIAESEALYRASLEMRRELLGDEHALVAQSLGKLGGLLRAKGRDDEAEAAYRESLDILRRRLGDDHPHVALNLVRLAELLRDAGETAAAKSAASEALAIYRRKLPPDHPATAGAEGLLARLDDAL